MRRSSLLLSSIAFFLLSLTILLTSVQYWCFDRNFYEKEYARDNTAARIGMSDEDLMTSTNALLDYLEGERDDIVVEAEVFGDTRTVFNERETAHMVDVRSLYQGAVMVRNIAGASGVILLVVAFFLAKDRKKEVMRNGFLYGVGLLITLLAAVGLYAAMDFTAFWTSFHELFFSNDLWQLDPNTSIMINMFPEIFFSDLVVRIVLTVVLVHAIAAAVVCGAWRKR